MPDHPFELIGTEQVLWRHATAGSAGAVGVPVFEVDGDSRRAVLRDIRQAEPPLTLPHGVTKYLFEGRFIEDDDLALRMVWPLRLGAVGGSPEVHEKIYPPTGCGIVVVFAASPGRYVYVTENRVADTWASPNGTPVRLDVRGRAVLECVFEQPGDQVVFFGAHA